MTEHDDHARDDNAYLVGHLEEALAGSGETDVRVQVGRGSVVLTGNVTTQQRRDEVAAIANDLVTDLAVQNEVVVLSPREPTAQETIG